ncbi:hypothetical protein L1987_15447 [Smallanthus sonchifolius]|uniref:Uncharacterized protein n=1 Tax=Smallanthus sonchifolius TaxID=185202 RepID=A0ACB9J6L9_9ASTR|nr:hypothetical protein L1987_15447 [Smallanthus sonchifolius]
MNAKSAWCHVAIASDSLISTSKLPGAYKKKNMNPPKFVWPLRFAALNQNPLVVNVEETASFTLLMHSHNVRCNMIICCQCHQSWHTLVMFHELSFFFTKFWEAEPSIIAKGDSVPPCSSVGSSLES